MAGSQLKRLKSSLRDQGIIGPQKSKKQKKQAAEEARANGSSDKRLRKAAALETIREQFNPFQFKMNARGPKFPVTSLRSQKEGLRGIKGRPQMALSRSEEKRRNTLLIDMQRRNKVGGILDRRLGEGDPNMTPEERALERFAFEKQRMHNKKGAMFDLEDDGDDVLGLTHMGQSLAVGGPDENDDDDDEGRAGHGLSLRDDFNEDGLSDGSDEDEDGDDTPLKRLKRLRSELQGEEDGGGDGGPERKKTKKEVMQEVIAKSKLHKYERQVTREADDDERAELDKMLPELQQLLFSAPKQAAATAGKESKKGEGEGALADKVDRAVLEKSYDLRLRELMQDKKAEPTQRTKTEEELAAEQSAHLRKLEESRIKRMLGQLEYEEGSDGEDEDEEDGKGKGKGSSKGKNSGDDDDDDGRLFSFPGQENEDEFQLGQGIRVRHTAAELGFDDEDDFLIDDDLVASGSELDEAGEDSESESKGEEGGDGNDDDDDDDDEFTRGLLTEEEKNDPAFAAGRTIPTSASASTKTERERPTDDDGIPYTFPCPQTHEELLAVLGDVPPAKLATAVQRIRALHHPKLEAGNKEKLGRFAAALVVHVTYLADRHVSYVAIESLVRHVHSLAKMAPIEVAVAFREQLARISSSSSSLWRLSRGDLAILTAAAMFPTSDHFHPVVTPAVLTMARFLEQRVPRTLADYGTGLFVCTLLLQYQQLARRYVPELLNSALGAVLALAPTPLPPAARRRLQRQMPVHKSSEAVRLRDGTAEPRRLRPSDCEIAESEAAAEPRPEAAETAIEIRKASLLATAVAVLSAAAALWAGKAALAETLSPVTEVLRHVATAKLGPALRRDVARALATVEAAGAAAQLARRPLELHHHRPLAIRTLVPRFEDEFDPDKHYDPNRERAEAAKLQAEFKRERKGALRELRKDAAFMAREQLKLKKARDAAYEKKYRRLVAEIQGQEGQAANEYERERQKRKRK